MMCHSASGLYDSYLGIGEDGVGLTESYRELDDNWQPFNRSFIVVYESGREAELREILGEWAAPSGAAEIALITAQEEASRRPAGFLRLVQHGHCPDPSGALRGSGCSL